jgi:DNA-binding NarL/FixJ family response regulator
MSTPLRVLVADDHAVVRMGLKSLIDAQPDMQVVCEADDGLAAVASASRVAPDVAVLDITMPGLNGIEATVRLKQTSSHMKVLTLTVHEDPSYLKQVLDAGASGYVLKRSAAAELVEAIRTVAAGGTYVDPIVAGKLLSGFNAEASANKPVAGAELSQREEEVLRLIAQGYSTKEVAARLRLSSKTVETYKARSIEKLNLLSRVDIVRYALHRGWLQES